MIEVGTWGLGLEQLAQLGYGFSLANDAGIICSDPKIAIPGEGGPLGNGYGLHDKGKKKVKESAALLAEHLFGEGKYAGDGDEPVKIFCSPFKRTVETAAIISDTLNELVFTEKGAVAPVEHAYALRESYFGDFDMKPDSTYDIVWEEDNSAPDHGENSQYNVESPSSVCDRATRFIVEEIENKMQGKTVVLVCHGDICQITLCAAAHVEPWRQREVKHVNTAEWRDFADL
ncbi:hypothetical protein DM01DRAFT_1113312 [Hesseltinella vesiculosa]|uniref:Phosphoglycerate mutase-like protein n=1 Tax=Hesseltinella vesiculosa TaxID=101127 RepID=A0A1X2GA31_9FUNG|nr:hypothetical protein DM01DRAFT_1113312 [Hesseltinella vesiculosa]